MSCFAEWKPHDFTWRAHFVQYQVEPAIQWHRFAILKAGLVQLKALKLVEQCFCWTSMGTLAHAYLTMDMNTEMWPAARHLLTVLMWQAAKSTSKRMTKSFLFYYKTIWLTNFQFKLGSLAWWISYYYYFFAYVELIIHVKQSCNKST